MFFQRGNFPVVLLGVVLGLILLPPALARGSEVIPRLRTYLEPAHLQQGGRTSLTVEVNWEGAPTDLEFEAPVPPSLSLLKLIGSRKKSLAYYRDGSLRQVRRYIFTYQAVERGEGELAPCSLTYQRPGKEGEYSLRGEALKIGVDSAASAVLRKIIFPPVLIAAGLTAIFFYIRWTVRRYRRRTRELIEAYRQDLEEESLQELGRARKLKVEGDMEAYLSLLEKVIVSYLEKRYSLKVTRENLRGELPLTPPARSALIEIFDLLEEARFGSLPEGEREREVILKKARAFLEEQKKMNESPPPPV